MYVSRQLGTYVFVYTYTPMYCTVSRQLALYVQYIYRCMSLYLDSLLTMYVYSYIAVYLDSLLTMYVYSYTLMYLDSSVTKYRYSYTPT